MLWFGHAGLDTDLAEALYSFDDDPDNRPLYFDVISTLSSLILPPAPGVVGVRGLDVVTRMVGASSLA
jgi:hypothetical protein